MKTEANRVWKGVVLIDDTRKYPGEAIIGLVEKCEVFGILFGVFNRSGALGPAPTWSHGIRDIIVDGGQVFGDIIILDNENGLALSRILNTIEDVGVFLRVRVSKDEILAFDFNNVDGKLDPSDDTQCSTKAVDFEPLKNMPAAVDRGSEYSKDCGISQPDPPAPGRPSVGEEFVRWAEKGWLLDVKYADKSDDRAECSSYGSVRSAFVKKIDDIITERLS